MSADQGLEQIVGGLALDLIGSIRETMENDGDDVNDFKVTGALLFVTCEDTDTAGWYFTATNPASHYAKLGLTEMAADVARGKGVAE